MGAFPSATPGSVAIVAVGEASAPPDLARLRFDVKEAGGSLTAAFEAADGEAQTIVEALQEAGVKADDIEVDGPSFVLMAEMTAMKPVPMPQEGGEDAQIPEARDYNANASVTCSVSFDPTDLAAGIRKVSEVVEALDEEMIAPTKVSFDVKDRAALEARAYADAMAQADESAKRLAASAEGLKPGKIIGVMDFDFGKMMQSMMGGMFGGGLMGQMMQGMFGGGGEGTGNTREVTVERMLVVSFAAAE